jgi:NAD(P)-dependent dehydrogenase (short-subunit alcohol dehydrogenase family)
MARSVPQLPGRVCRRTTRPPDTCGLVGVVYSASKGAVLALTRAVAADESQYGVRVNCVSPSTVEGPWLQRLDLASDEPETR